MIVSGDLGGEHERTHTGSSSRTRVESAANDDDHGDDGGGGGGGSGGNGYVTR